MTFNSQMLHIATVKKCRVWRDQAAYKPGYYK
jgi:hypothetical protein